MTESLPVATGASPFTGVRACVFDAYGTLFDVGSAAARLRVRLGDATSALATLWREKQLQYTWLRTAQGRHADFAQVTRDAVGHALEALRLDPSLAGELLAAFDTLDAFPEVGEVLAEVRAAGLAAAVLSNGTPAMLASLLGHAGLADAFDAVYSVEAVGAFKPDPRVYALACDGLGLPAGQICFLSSNAWDAHGASAFGMRVAWCNRRGQADDRLPGRPDARISTLAELPGLLAGAGLPRA